MAATSDSVGDDWEYLDDSDGLSVISLSDSEHHSLPIAQPSKVTKAAINSLEHTLVPSSMPQSGLDNLDRKDYPSHSSKEEASEDNVTEHSIPDTRSDVGSDTSHPQSEDVPNGSNEIASIAQTTDLLITLIPELLQHPSFRNHSLVKENVIRTESLDIVSDLQRIREILYVYARHGGQGGVANELPAGFSIWLERLKSVMLCFRAGLDTDQNSHDTVISWSDFLRQLKCFSSDMKALVAIITSDYEDFHTLHMPEITALAEDSPVVRRKAHDRSHNRITSTGNGLSHLRGELYALKDQIGACLHEIRCYNGTLSSSDSDQAERLKILALRYKKIGDGLAMMLSNHGGDWIDYSIAGGLTYPQFCQLNPDMIRSVITELKEATDRLFRDRKLNQASPEHGPVENVASLGGFFTIEELLASILRIRSDA